MRTTVTLHGLSLLLVALASGCTALNDFSQFTFADAGGPCGAGLTDCGGACVDTDSDDAHCGGCGIACDPTQECVEGACLPQCTNNETRCGTECVDTDSDDAHCGGCDIACDTTQECVEGACLPQCTNNETRCGTQCVDTDSDDAHCGGCGIACDPTQECIEGACLPQCTNNETRCGTECVDTDSDDAHCGGCDSACSPTQECIEAVCLPRCTIDETRCDGVCVDTEFDNAHCGGCDIVCDSGRVCSGGSCLPETREWRFTTCGQTGRLGPSAEQCASAYAGTSLDGAVTVTDGIQHWTVPESGLYRIEARGAQGASAEMSMRGGAGAVVAGTFELHEGDVLSILVGQKGTTSADVTSGGGGGGSFVSRGTELLLAAGGGGGVRMAAVQDGCPGLAGPLGGTGSFDRRTHTCEARIDGARTGGASAGSYGAGGGGVDTAGEADGPYGTGGAALASGAAGGTGISRYCSEAYSDGGFGGGGSGNGCFGGGGGGGYSGGDGGWIAGGGGSFNAGTMPEARSGENFGHGAVTIWRCSDDGDCHRQCLPSERLCDGTCADVETDPQHCGACASSGGAVCGLGETCADGACIAVQCPPPEPPPRSGLVSFTDTTVGAIASYTCEPDHVMIDHSILTCQPDGTWSGPGTPACYPSSTTLLFPSETDSRTPGIPSTPGWNVEGVRTTEVPSISSLVFRLSYFPDFGCPPSFAQMRMSVNGQVVGTLVLNLLFTSETFTFSFERIEGPTYTIRLETTSMSSTCGFTIGVSTVELRY